MLSAGRLGTGKDGIVAGAANRLHQGFRPGTSWIENHGRTVRHEINACRFYSGRRAKRLLDMVLTGCAGHAQHRQGHRLCGRFSHSGHPAWAGLVSALESR